MTRAEKLIIALMILIIAGIAVLYWRQSQAEKERRRMENEWLKNPLLEPANSTNTAPEK